MSGHPIPHFHNDVGHELITIGTKKFMCVGANPPFDHPHIYLDMGEDSEIVCPYCSTLFRYDNLLPVEETIPVGCAYQVKADV